MLQTEHTALSVTHSPCGKHQGKQLYKVILANNTVSVTVTNLGCSILSVTTPDKNGNNANVVAALHEPADYQHNEYYLGTVVGRYANRIANGRFTIDGQQFELTVNNPPNHLHGGKEGFHTKAWELIAIQEAADKVGVVFQYNSADGEEGYPGNLAVEVKYTLDQYNNLGIWYSATTDRKTPVNLTNHSYFNLSGFQQPLIYNHCLQVNAATYTEKNEHNIPTGALLAVAQTPLDFLQLKRIGEHIGDLPADRGYDHNFVLNKATAGELVLAVVLTEPESGRLVRVFTDQPGIQVYTANYWDGTITGQQNTSYQQHGAIALETQAYPDSPNHPEFPNTLLLPGEIYHTTTIYQFGLL